ncbi:MAG: hypothetical protein QM487_04775 [Candidatus Marithrix sp.]
MLKFFSSLIISFKLSMSFGNSFISLSFIDFFVYTFVYLLIAMVGSYSYPYNGDGNIGFDNIPYGTTNMSIINASSKLGLDGEIKIDAFEEDFTGHLIPRDGNFQGLEMSLSRCGSFDDLGSFIITVKDISPPSPNDLRN